MKRDQSICQQCPHKRPGRVYPRDCQLVEWGDTYNAATKTYLLIPEDQMRREEVPIKCVRYMEHVVLGQEDLLQNPVLIQ